MGNSTLTKEPSNDRSTAQNIALYAIFPPLQAVGKRRHCLHYPVSQTWPFLLLINTLARGRGIYCMGPLMVYFSRYNVRFSLDGGDVDGERLLV